MSGICRPPKGSVTRPLELSTPAQASALAELMAWTGRGGRGFVVDSFWSAWDAFALSGSYRETIEHAVGYGNDTDTTAAMPVAWPDLPGHRTRGGARQAGREPENSGRGV